MLAGCGLISDRSSEYMQADLGQDIQLPAGMNWQDVSPKYPVPEISNQRSLPVEFELPEPPDATAALKVAPYLIESYEDEVWLHLFSAPNNVWPQVELFWSQYNLDILNDDVRSGFLTTQKLDERKGSQNFLQQFEQIDPEALVFEGMSFQARAMHGVRRNTTEVQVRALLPNQDPSAHKSWVPDSMNPRAERALLEMIGRFVTSEGINSRHSLLASEIGGESRVKLLENQWGDSYLALNLSSNRAWNELDQAIEAAGIIVADRDLQNRTFYISYLDQDDLESWYHTSSMIEARQKERNFALRLFRQEDGTVIVTVEKLNPELDEGLDKQILDLVFEYIS